ncbi:MAG: WD40 repeat domain-containing protein [Gemmataceae bacterium]
MPTRYLAFVLLIIAGVLGAEPKRDCFGDPLPEGAIARLGSLRLRAEQTTLSAVFMADGKTLATVGHAQCIRIWDRDTGKLVRRVKLSAFSGASRFSTDPRFSADGKTLILGMWDHTIRFLDTTSGAEKRKLSFPKRGNVRALEVSRDGKTLAALHGGKLVVWDVSSGKPRHEFKGLDKVLIPPGRLLALTPDGKQLALPRGDGSLRLVDTASGKEIRTFKAERVAPDRIGHPLPVISPDGRYLALRYYLSRRTLLHDLATGKTVREWDDLTVNVGDLAFTPDSRFLVRGSSHKVELFSVLSGKARRELLVPFGSRGVLVFSPDGQTLATCRNGCTIDLWDMASGRSLHSPVGHVAEVNSMVFFPDGKRLASSDPGGNLIVWDINSARELAHHEDNMVARMIANSLAVEWADRQAALGGTAGGSAIEPAAHRGQALTRLPCSLDNADF